MNTASRRENRIFAPHTPGIGAADRIYAPDVFPQCSLEQATLVVGKNLI